MEPFAVVSNIPFRSSSRVSSLLFSFLVSFLLSPKQGNSGHVTEFMGTFLFFSGLNAAGGNNFHSALALSVAASCYGGDLNPAVTFANAMQGGFSPNSGLFMTIFFQSAGAFAAGKVKEFADA